MSHDDDAADGLSFPVELDEPASQVRTEVHLPNVAHEDRGAGAVRPDRDFLDVVDGLDVPATAHHVLGAVELDEPPADLVVRAADGIRDLVKRQVEGKE